MHITQEAWFPSTWKFARKHGMLATASSYISSYVRTFHNYLSMRTQFWWEPPFIFARLGDSGNPCARKKLAGHLLTVVDDPTFEDRVAFHALGYLKTPAFVSALRNLAAGGAHDKVVQSMLEKDFRRLPVHNAAMECIFRDLTDITHLASYTPETLTAVVRQQTQHLATTYPLCDAEVTAHRTSVREKRKRDASETGGIEVQTESRPEAQKRRRQEDAAAKATMPTDVNFDDAAVEQLNEQVESSQGRADDQARVEYAALTCTFERHKELRLIELLRSPDPLVLAAAESARVEEMWGMCCHLWRAARLRGMSGAESTSPEAAVGMLRLAWDRYHDERAKLRPMVISSLD